MIWLCKDDFDIPIWSICQIFLVGRKEAQNFFCLNLFNNIKPHIQEARSTKYHKRKTRPSIHFYQQFQLLSFLEFLDHISPVKYSYSTKKQQMPSNQCFQLSFDCNFCSVIWWANLLSLMKMLRKVSWQELFWKNSEIPFLD